MSGASVRCLECGTPFIDLGGEHEGSLNHTPNCQCATNPDSKLEFTFLDGTTVVYTFGSLASLDKE